MASIRFGLATLLAASTTGRLTLSIWFLDASSSMRRFRNVPPQAVNRYLEQLRGDGTQYHAMALVAFGPHYRVDIPAAPVGRIGEYTGYRTSVGTLLYQTVKRGLQGLVEEWNMLTPNERSRVRIVVHIFSDGWDSSSPTASYPEALTEYSALARRNGWELLANGIGISGEELANRMGFDPALAISVDPTPTGIEIATDRAGEHTSRARA